MENIFVLLLGAVLAFILTGCEKEEKAQTPAPKKKVFSYLYINRPYTEDEPMVADTGYGDFEHETEAEQMVTAARWGDVEHMQKLHEQGVALSPQAGLGDDVALVEAVKHRQIEVIRYLLDNGVDPDSFDRSASALHSAAWAGWLDGVKLLIERGANANGPVVEDGFIMPPYFTALYLNKLGVARFLLDNGADGAYTGSNGYTALFAAIDKYPYHHYIPSPFEDNSNLAAVKFAVANGADIHAVFSHDELTPLIMAAVYQSRDAYDYLVSLGADPDKKDFLGNTPAEYMNGTKVHPAYIFEDFYKEEALLRAIRPDVSLEKVRLLVERGADVNRGDIDFECYTPLVLAAVYQRRDIYDYLLANGADANVHDGVGNRAMDYLAGGKKHLGRLFTSYYAEGNATEASPKRRSDEKPQDYLITLNSSAGNPVRVFFNGTLVRMLDGEGNGFIPFNCGEYLIAGENKVRISWGRMPGEPGWDEALVRYDDPSNFFLRFKAIYDKEGGDTETVFEKKLTQADSMTFDGVLVPAYEFSFHSDFSSALNNVLAQADVCNRTSEDADANIALMRAFARDVYMKLNSGDLDWLVQKSQRSLEIAAASSGQSLEDETAFYRQGLAEAWEEGLDYTLESEEQIVLLPSFGGKLWQIVVMGSAEAGAQLMHEVKMQVETPPGYEYDYGLIQFRAGGGVSLIIGCRIAKFDGLFAIVR